MISFFVHGVPIPKGSAKAVPGPVLGKPCGRCGQRKRGYPKVTHDNPKTKSWESSVRATARASMPKFEKLDGAVEVRLQFFMPRPKSHYVASNPERPLKKSAPEFHTVKPDLDKLVRCVLDGLSDICFGDDASVVRVMPQKEYITPGSKPGVMIEIEQAQRQRLRAMPSIGQGELFDEI